MESISSIPNWITENINRISSEVKYIQSYDRTLHKYYVSKTRKYYNVSTILPENPSYKIDEIYVPLTLVNKHKEESVKIDGYPKSLLSKSSRVLIEDNAGAGKTTLLRYIFLKSVSKSKRVPVFIELRRVKDSSDIISYIHKEISEYGGNIEKKFVKKIFDSGDFLLCLDGYDEISSNELQEQTEKIRNFVSAAGSNKVIITSRPSEGLSSFGDFERFEIKPLEKEESYNLLRKYDKDGSVSESLINHLESNPKTENRIRSFLKNPLLTTLLYNAYEYNAKIPFKKHVFYRQVYNALYDRHDLKKDAFDREKRCGLDRQEFHRVLQYVSIRSIMEGVIEYEYNDIIDLIKKSKESLYNLEFDPDKFLSDLVTRVPLLTQDSPYYEWAHRSIQEYFAAEYIRNSTDCDSILKKLLESDRITQFAEILDIFYDLDKKSFDVSVTYRIIEEYEKHMSSCNIHEGVGEVQARKIKRIIFGGYLDVQIMSDKDFKMLNNEDEESGPPSFVKKMVGEIEEGQVGRIHLLSLGDSHTAVIFHNTNTYGDLLYKLEDRNAKWIKNKEIGNSNGEEAELEDLIGDPEDLTGRYLLRCGSEEIDRPKKVEYINFIIKSIAIPTIDEKGVKEVKSRIESNKTEDEIISKL